MEVKNIVSTLVHNKLNTLFILLILLILFLLWNAPSIEGPPMPNDADHRNVEKEISCMTECHTFEDLVKENRNHPLKTECLECHQLIVTPTD